MAYLKNLSKISYSPLPALVFVLTCIWISVPSLSFAAFASKFSLSAGEQYSDNIFFTKQKEHDFVTVITPTLNLLWAPSGETVPTGNLNITPTGQIFGRHSELSNFGDNVFVNGGLTHRLSPRVSLNISDSFVRSSGIGNDGGSLYGFDVNGAIRTPTSLSPIGGVTPLSRSQTLKDFVSAGDRITNQFDLQGAFRCSENINITGGYTNGYTSFLDAGGKEIFHTIGARGVYNWRREHNLHAGYYISVVNSRNRDNNVIHNFDIGDDYFSNLQIRFSPTLVLAASTGVSFNAGDRGPQIANNTNVTITKIWQTATFSAAFQKGLTPSFGVAGVSDTTSLVTAFDIRLTEKLSANTGADLSYFDTDDLNFKTFRGSAGLQYQINSWLSSSLSYSFRWVDSGAEASGTDLLEKGIVRGNAVFISLTAAFDLWPNTGPARNIPSRNTTPLVTTPFPISSPSNITPAP